MSQFGFFNTPQGVQPTIRPAPFAASHSAFDVAPRRDDPYARAPSPRGSFFGSPVTVARAPSPPRGGGFFAPSPALPSTVPMRAHSPPRATFFGSAVGAPRAASPPRATFFGSAVSAPRAPSPSRGSFFGSAVAAARAPSPPRATFYGSAVSVPRAPSPIPRGAFIESAPVVYAPQPGPVYAPPPGPMDARAYDSVVMPSSSVFYQTRAPTYETRDSWRSEPRREERREFFSGGDTWRSAPRRSPPRDRFNSDAFSSRRDYSPDRRRSFKDDRSPVRREDRRFDDKPKKDYKERRSYGDRKRERSEGDKRDESKDKRERRSSRERDSKERVNKENGEKKRRVDDKKDEIREEIEKEEENIEPEETIAEHENNDNDDKDVEIIEEDEYEEAAEVEKSGSNGVEEKIEEPKRDEPKKSYVKKHEDTRKSEKPDDRQSRIRSPSLEKKSRSSSVEKERKSRFSDADSPPKKKKDDSGFRIITDASFDEIHRPFERPYGNFNKGNHSRDLSSSHKRHSGDDSWFSQYKAKVMMTKIAVQDLSGPPAAPLPPPVVPVAVPAPIPYLAPPVAHDPLAAVRDVLARLPPRAAPSAYPPVAAAPPRFEYPVEYGRSPAAYGAPPAHIDHVARRDPMIDAIRHEWTRDEREAYERRLAEELRGRSPPRREVYAELKRRDDYDRRDDRRDDYDRREYERRDERYERREERRDEYERRPEGHHVEYHTERYRAERPEERARYADRGADLRDRTDERPRYADRSPPLYDRAAAAVAALSMPREDRERESRRPSSRSHRAPSPTLTERLAERLGMDKAAGRVDGRGGVPEKPTKRTPPVEEIDASKLVEPLEEIDGWDDLARLLSPEKVVVEKKAKKPLIATMPPAPVGVPPPSHHRPVSRDPLPVSGFFNQPVPSVHSKIAYPDSQPFYKKNQEEPRPSFFPAPAESRPRAASGAEAEAYGRAMSYEELASSNGAAAYRSGPAPGWERGRGH